MHDLLIKQKVLVSGTAVIRGPDGKVKSHMTFSNETDRGEPDKVLAATSEHKPKIQTESN
jgi:uncharacterized lipoprotein YmbA